MYKLSGDNCLWLVYVTLKGTTEHSFGMIYVNSNYSLLTDNFELSIQNSEFRRGIQLKIFYDRDNFIQ